MPVCVGVGHPGAGLSSDEDAWKAFQRGVFSVSRKSGHRQVALHQGSVCRKQFLFVGWACKGNTPMLLAGFGPEQGRIQETGCLVHTRRARAAQKGRVGAARGLALFVSQRRVLEIVGSSPGKVEGGTPQGWGPSGEVLCLQGTVQCERRGPSGPRRAGGQPLGSAIVAWLRVAVEGHQVGGQRFAG